MPLYRGAKKEFGRVIGREIGVSSKKAVATLESQDRVNFQRYGVSRRRFPKSMSDAYEILAREEGLKPKARIRERVRRIGRKVFERRSVPIPGVAAILSLVKKAGIVTVLCSKGDVRIQKKRVEENGLAQLFDRIYVVPEKDEKEFLEILQEFGFRGLEACSVGNSVRNDINPALRIGMRAIWVSNETWSLEDEEPVRGERLTIANSLSQIVSLLRLSDMRGCAR